MAGTILVLNGPSSAGKTTIAHAVRDASVPRVVAVSLDSFFACIAPTQPREWRVYAALTAATFAAAAAWASAGFDVVVDTVFERPECMDIARAALVGHMVHLVAVTCAVELLDAREQARGDRRIGQARGQHARVLGDFTYVLTLDTGALSVEECVERVTALLAS
jgi:chloramphenicol 3-O phosphotransferase